MHAQARMLAALAVLMLLTTTSIAGTASAAPSTDLAGHVYVNNNSAGVNTVSGFDRHADGTLSPMARSPFVVGGAGTGTITGSQGALQRSTDGRYLLAVDAGSNQISRARIDHDGTLRPVESCPVAAGGIKPISI